MASIISPAALDLAGKHPPAAPLAEIGGNHVLGDARERHDLQIERESREHRLDRRHRRVSEPLGGSCRHGQDIELVAHVRKRNGAIVGEVGRRQGLDHRQMLRIQPVVAADAQRLSQLQHSQRAQLEQIGLAEMSMDAHLVADTELQPPDGGEADQLRMEGTHVQRGAIDRQAGANEPDHRPVKQLRQPAAARLM
jgi:hypothetical protein